MDASNSQSKTSGVKKNQLTLNSTKKAKQEQAIISIPNLLQSKIEIII